MEEIDRYGRPVLWSKFVYDYTFEMDYGKQIKVVIDHPFDEISDLESISRFPHVQRRQFAKHILATYPTAEKYQCLETTDILNPFARKLTRIFAKGLQIYWTKRPRDILLIITENDSSEEVDSKSL